MWETYSLSKLRKEKGNMSKRIRHIYIVTLAFDACKALEITPFIQFSATMTNLRLIIWHLIILSILCKRAKKR